MGRPLLLLILPWRVLSCFEDAKDSVAFVFHFRIEEDGPRIRQVKVALALG
ncbi:hypothetical protein L484_006829 [Morus notabilis]|uniref:Uncharacterized protein n=1 Tax=Morus notabilis TaxID=981085 RepID=W9RP42_9ROSA|nr:hypothetical protein L484_006829 [Morus notabilis]